MTLDVPPYRINLPIIGGEFPVTRYRLQLAAAIVHSAWQQRPRMEQNETLMAVAQERAEFLANVADINAIDENHTFPEDERAPNAWVVQAGYSLPSSYDLDKNFVESYATGQRTVDEVVDTWLRSPAHKAHLTGAGWGFSRQWQFGIGVALVGRYKPAWTFISAP